MNELCDKCQIAKAQVFIELPSGKVLFFCYHDFREIQTALESIAVVIELVGDLATTLTDSRLATVR